MRRRTIVSVWSLVLALSACGDDVAPRASAESIMDRGPVATLHEELRIDGHDAGLMSTSGLAEAEDGTLAVPQFEDRTVRLYTAEGAFLDALGGEGEGPGEFQMVAGVAWRGSDSLVVHDRSQRRMTVLPVSGGYPRTVPVGPPLDPRQPSAELIPFARMRHDGSILALAHTLSREGSRTRVERLVVLGPEPGQEREVARLVSPDPKVEARTGSWAGSAALPSANLPAVRLAEDGSRVLIALADLEGDRAGTFSLIALGADGDTLLDRRYAFEPIEVTPAYADSAIEAYAARIAPPLARLYREQAQYPPLMKPILGVLDGADGTIWLSLRRSSGERIYTVLDEAGGVVGQVPMPRGVFVAIAARSHLWTVEIDEWGVPSLVRYRLDWT
jgi:hypothetical protein